MKVLKFGGTSVGSAERIKEVARLINNGEKKIVVLSAMSGTTNSLVDIVNSLAKNDVKGAQDSISNLKVKYHNVVKELLTSYEGNNRKGDDLINHHFAILHSFTQKATITPADENEILAQGELISTALMHYHLRELGVKSALLPALEFMCTDENAEPDSQFIKENIAKHLAANPDTLVYITQGFICKNTNGDIDNLQRGGSDYTATLVGAAVGASEIEIWTDIDGMHNNDPRFVEGTRPIAHLSFNEAAELAYFGAKILHPTCIRPAAKTKIPVKLLNTMEPKAAGTTISSAIEKGRVAAIAAKDDITAIKIKSGRMLLAHGFLRKIFEIFEEHKTSIDMITTSEVGVSLTIDDNKHLSQIEKELKKLGDVTLDEKQVIICIAGDFTPENSHFAAKVTEALSHIPVRMISYGGSKYNISVLVDAEHKKEALNLLSKELF
jgi:aspartate kinase